MYTLLIKRKRCFSHKKYIAKIFEIISLIIEPEQNREAINDDNVMSNT